MKARVPALALGCIVGLGCRPSAPAPVVEVAPSHPAEAPPPSPTPSDDSIDDSWDRRRCGDFTLSDVTALCESITIGCTEQCSDLQSAIAMNPIRVEGETNYVILFCGQFLFTWWQPEEFAAAPCLPRPDCFYVEYSLMPEFTAGQTHWYLQPETWWDLGGICKHWPEPGAPVVPVLFRRVEDGEVEYLYPLDDGGHEPAPLLPTSLGEFLVR